MPNAGSNNQKLKLEERVKLKMANELTTAATAASNRKSALEGRHLGVGGVIGAEGVKVHGADLSLIGVQSGRMAEFLCEEIRNYVHVLDLVSHGVREGRNHPVDGDDSNDAAVPTSTSTPQAKIGDP